MESKDLEKLREEIRDLLNQIMIKTKDVERTDTEDMCEAFIVNVREYAENALNDESNATAGDPYYYTSNYYYSSSC